MAICISLCAYFLRKAVKQSCISTLSNFTSTTNSFDLIDVIDEVARSTLSHEITWKLGSCHHHSPLHIGGAPARHGEGKGSGS